MALDIAAALSWKGAQEGNDKKYLHARNYSSWEDFAATWDAGAMAIPSQADVQTWHDAAATERQAAATADTANLDTVRTIVARLEAGTATSAQIQRALAWVLRKVIRLLYFS